MNTQSLELLTLPCRDLISNNTFKTLSVGNDIVTDMGLVPLLEALPRLQSLKKLELVWFLSIQMKL